MTGDTGQADLGHPVRVFALVDANQFYVSCERLFRPDLRHEPVVVMSNNDGCAVARSPEARRLGVQEGQPIFQLGALKEQVQCFSSNYALYGEISRRMMQVLEGLSPLMEVYSIDEAFLEFRDVRTTLMALPDLPARWCLVDSRPENMCQPDRLPRGMTLPEQLASRIQELVYRQTGLPVSVGMGPTRSLAKLASGLAKKRPGRIMDLSDPARRPALMDHLPLARIWGIGAAGIARLARYGVATVGQLCQLPDQKVQQELTRKGLALVRELRGQICTQLELLPPPRKQVVVARAFGTTIEDFATLRETIVRYTVRAAEKLQRAGRLAGQLSVFIRTDPFMLEQPQYMNAVQMSLVQATADPTILIRWAVAGLQHIFKPGYAYRKSGVVCNELIHPQEQQFDLFIDPGGPEATRSHRLQQLLAKANAYPGQRKLFLAGAGPRRRAWEARSQSRSPAYLSRWSNLPVVRS